MKRIMVIGCCGAGKSTLSKKLNSITNIELFHLDQYYWKPGWEETKAEDWQKIVKEIAQKDKWIIDGNYRGTMDLRLERADTIIYLNYSTLICLWRITKRILKYRGQVRPDMPEGCKERFDLEFYLFVSTFNLKRRNKIIEKLDTIKPHKEIIIIRNDKMLIQYLTNLEEKSKK